MTRRTTRSLFAAAICLALLLAGSYLAFRGGAGPSHAAVKLQNGHALEIRSARQFKDEQSGGIQVNVTLKETTIRDLREIWGQERPLEVEVDVRASKVLAAEFEVVDASIYRTETNGPVPRKQQPYYTDPVPAGLAAQFFLRGLEPADYDLALFLRARHSDVDPEKWAAQIEKDRNGWLVIIAHVYRL